MIIGITGIAGSGKDACADILVREFEFVKVALADPIKRMCRDAFGFSYEQMWGPSAARNAPDKRYPRKHGPFVGSDWEPPCLCCGARNESQCYLTPRFALQQLGTEWGRHCYPNTWVDHALRVAEKLNEGGYWYAPERGLDLGGPKTSVVIPDVRFKNEVDGLRAIGAKLIRVVRPNAGLGGAAGQHVSETEQTSIPDEMFDAVIQNDGTLVDLSRTINGIVQRLED